MSKAPGIVADNCVKPGSPVYCWHTTVPNGVCANGAGCSTSVE